jgi:hypothetical protein
LEAKRKGQDFLRRAGAEDDELILGVKSQRTPSNGNNTEDASSIGKTFLRDDQAPQTIFKFAKLAGS